MELNPAVLAHVVELRTQAQPDFRVLTFDYADHDEAVTYADLWRGAQVVALALAEAGVKPGDRFAIMMRNHAEFTYAMAAASLTGTAFVPLDPRMRGAKLRYMIEHSRAHAVVCSHDVLAPLGEVLDRPDAPPLLVTRIPAGAALPPRALDLGHLLAAPPARTLAQQVSDPKTPWQILYTSGTTGDPKGVVCDNARFGVYAMTGKFVFGYADNERLYTGLSLTHGNAQAVTFANAVAHGLPGVISERFSKSRLWDVCRKHGCTTFSLLGGMATAIYAEPRRADDADNPVRVVVSAGMPLAIWEDFERRFAVKILEWYGAVDGGLAVKPVGTGPVGSFGKPLPMMEMKVVDENDQECPPGAVGELICRNVAGPTEIEYLDNPEASHAKTRGGWIRSGDMCHRDADGWLFFDFRKGGGLRRSGDFVSPDYVERAAIESGLVSDVFCYGVPAASGAPGESDVVLALVPAPGRSFDAAAAFRELEARLEPNFVPSYLQVVAEIPKTISEKPQARLLAEALGAPGAAVHRHDDFRARQGTRPAPARP